MGNRALSFNPYTVLGVDQTASDGVIQQVFRRRLAEDPGAAVRLRHAYRILKNPEQRKQLDEELERLIWEGVDLRTTAKAPAGKRKPRGVGSLFRLSRWRLLVLGVLVVALSFSSYLSFVQGQDIICPDCHHASVIIIDEASDGRSILRCTRKSCGFTYVHEPTREEGERAS